MLRVGMVGLAGMLAATVTAGAQSPVERGGYLVNSVLTCGNCHTPRGPGGVLAMDKQLSGGPQEWDTPTFKVKGANITPDRETGIGSWSEADIKRALARWRAAQRRRSWRRSCRTASTRSSPPRDLDAIVAYLRSVPAVSNKVAGAGLQGRAARRNPARCREADGRRRPERPGQARLLSGDHRPLHGVPHAARERQHRTLAMRSARAARSSTGRGACRCRATSPRIGRRASAPGATPRSSAPSPRACARTAARSSRRWAIRMYARMTDADLSDVVAYLRTVPPKE